MHSAGSEKPRVHYICSMCNCLMYPQSDYHHSAAPLGALSECEDTVYLRALMKIENIA